MPKYTVIVRKIIYVGRYSSSASENHVFMFSSCCFGCLFTAGISKFHICEEFKEFKIEAQATSTKCDQYLKMIFSRCKGKF